MQLAVGATAGAAGVNVRSYRGVVGDEYKVKQHALGTVGMFGDALSATAWAGVLRICAGVLSLGMIGGGATRKATAWALLNAVIIAVYTVSDAIGARAFSGPQAP